MLHAVCLVEGDADRVEHVVEGIAAHSIVYFVVLAGTGQASSFVLIEIPATGTYIGAASISLVVLPGSAVVVVDALARSSQNCVVSASKAISRRRIIGIAEYRNRQAVSIAEVGPVPTVLGNEHASS